MLEVQSITVCYSGLPVLREASISVREGQTVSVVGANGAGKSTLLKAIMGAARLGPEGGISFRSTSIKGLRTEQIVRLGLIYVPEDRKLFKPLAVEENLLLGGFVVDDEAQKRRKLEYVYDLFPRLRKRRKQAVGSLSGGERQMVAICRGLMSESKMLMLDEPSLGLASLMVAEVFDTVRKLRRDGLTVLLVEQNVREALELSDYAYIMQTGRLRHEGQAQDLLSDVVRKAFLGL